MFDWAERAPLSSATDTNRATKTSAPQYHAETHMLRSPESTCVDDVRRALGVFKGDMHWVKLVTDPNKREAVCLRPEKKDGDPRLLRSGQGSSQSRVEFNADQPPASPRLTAGAPRRPISERQNVRCPRNTSHACLSGPRRGRRACRRRRRERLREARPSAPGARPSPCPAFGAPGRSGRVSHGAGRSRSSSIRPEAERPLTSGKRRPCRGSRLRGAEHVGTLAGATSKGRGPPRPGGESPAQRSRRRDQSWTALPSPEPERTRRWMPESLAHP